MKELMGKKIKVDLGGQQIDAVVAAIDEEYGLTIHAKPEDASKLKLCCRNGEIFCINMNDPTKDNIFRMKVAAELIKTGVLDLREYDRRCGVKGTPSTGMVACPFTTPDC